MEPDRPYSVSLASAIASASSSERQHRHAPARRPPRASAGRWSSARAARSAGTTSRRRPARAPVNATSASVARTTATEARCPAEISGPISAVVQRRVLHPERLDRRLQQRQEPVVHRVLDEHPGPRRSSPGRRCRRRCAGAAAAARSRSASAKTMLALLPPSSRVTRFTCSAQPAMIDLPTSVEPVKQTLRTAGWVTNRCPTTRPLPGSTVNTSSRQPGLQGQLAQPDRGQRGQLGRLEHHRVAGRQRRGEPPAGDRHREVPRHDDADHAERLVEGHVDAAGHRDLPPGQPLRRAGVVVEHVADVAGLPAGVADGVPGVAHLQLGQLVEVLVHHGGEAAQQPCPVPRRDGRQAGKARARTLDRRVGLGRTQRRYGR